MTMREPLAWNDALLTGVDVIDEQHRILVAVLTQARAELTGDGSRGAFDRITRELLAYAIFHFDTEERLMAQQGYDPEAAAAHLREHREFSRRVVALRDEAADGGPVAVEALLVFLEDWLIHHIMGSDKKLGQCLGARP